MKTRPICSVLPGTAGPSQPLNALMASGKHSGPLFLSGKGAAAQSKGGFFFLNKVLERLTR